jgi:hypothetical protein
MPVDSPTVANAGLARCRIRPLPDAGAPREEVTTTNDIPALSAQPDIKSTR